MKRRFLALIMIGLLCAAGLAPDIAAQEKAPVQAVNLDQLKEKAPKVYIDCPECDIDYIRTEITFVNYVRDRKEADVHILITTQNTGSGGREYTLSFIGQNEWADVKNTLAFASNKTQTSDEIRNGLTQVLKMGLIGYAARTPIQPRLGVSFQDRVVSSTMIIEHVWDMNYEGTGNVVNVFINRLRDKIDKGAPKKLIRTVRGYGFTVGETDEN